MNKAEWTIIKELAETEITRIRNELTEITKRCNDKIEKLESDIIGYNEKINTTI